MLIIECRFPRSGNTFLAFLLERGLEDCQYVKIPREFASLEQLESFVSEARRDRSYLLGHNHLRNGWETSISGRHGIPIVFVFRNPLDCIASLLVLRHSKGSRRKVSGPRAVRRPVLQYLRIAAAAWSRRHHGDDILTFDALTTRPKETVAELGRFLATELRFDPTSVGEYMSSDFQQRVDNKPLAKNPTSGNRVHLGILQKALIVSTCLVPYQLLARASRRTHPT